jgi:hypothetical protein
MTFLIVKSLEDVAVFPPLSTAKPPVSAFNDHAMPERRVPCFLVP